MGFGANPAVCRSASANGCGHPLRSFVLAGLLCFGSFESTRMGYVSVNAMHYDCRSRRLIPAATPKRRKRLVQTCAHSGMTKSERYLAHIARRSFLSLWSHPNLFTDEGRHGADGDGKELCDLMVIFGPHILLFSDKACGFPAHPDPDVSWARWYKRAIAKSARQLLGAERWLRRYPSRVYLDKNCSTALTLPLPTNGDAVFHRIAVTRGSHTACETFYGGGSSGTPIIDTRIVGESHLEAPFRVGHVTSKNEFIHVFDELTLNVVMLELDTIFDFVDYLQKKEALLCRPGLEVIAMGEEELVAVYLKNIDKDRCHTFPSVPGDVGTLVIKEGYWARLVADARYLKKKEDDRISYLWDELIETFAAFGKDDAGYSNALEFEPSLRQLASENRLGRRYLAQTLYDAAHKDIPVGHRYLRITAGGKKEVAYVFLIVPQPEYLDFAEYQEARQALLIASCKVAKLLAKNATKVIGIAMEPANSKNRSEDLVLLETSEAFWGEKEEAEARQLQLDMKIFSPETSNIFATQVAPYYRHRKPPLMPLWMHGAPISSDALAAFGGARKTRKRPATSRRSAAKNSTR